MIENIVLLAVVLAINAFTLFLLMRDKELNELTEEGTLLVSKRFRWVYGCIFVVLNLAIACFFTYMYGENTLLFSLKRFAVLSVLWPVALIDLKTYRIPNVFVLTGLIYRAALLVPELFLEQSSLLDYLLEEVVAAVAITLAAFLCSICFKGSIGYGDIKLFIVMGLLLGMRGIWSAMFLSLFAAFVIAVCLLISKKKGRKDAVPFAPAILIGTYLSVILTGM